MGVSGSSWEHEHRHRSTGSGKKRERKNKNKNGIVYPENFCPASVFADCTEMEEMIFLQNINSQPPLSSSNYGIHSSSILTTSLNIDLSHVFNCTTCRLTVFTCRCNKTVDDAEAVAAGAPTP